MPGGDKDACEHIASRYSQDILPGSWRFDLVDYGTVRDTLWLEYKAQADIDVPSRFIGPPPREEQLLMPEFLAWPRRYDPSDSDPAYLKTNTFSSYTSYMMWRIDLMWAGVTDCRMSLVDQTSGLATIHGFTYAYIAPGEQDTVFIVPQDSVRMAYVTMCNLPVSTPDAEAASGRPKMSLIGPECQPRSRVSFKLWIREAGELRIGIYDVTGRCWRSIDLGRVAEGSRPFSWDGFGEHGELIPNGVYWVRATLSGATQTKRLLLLDR
jgi:hypothetical protein